MQNSFPDHTLPHNTAAEPPASPAPADSVRSVAPADEPPKVKSLKDLAAPYRDLAIEALAAVLQDEKAGPMSKIAAANSLLDRSDGKPTQFVEQTTKIVTYQDLLAQIAVKEEKFTQVIEAQAVKEIAPPKPPDSEWRDLL